MEYLIKKLVLQVCREQPNVIKYKHLKRADREGGTYTAKYREII
jgi:hypothetical protein